MLYCCSWCAGLQKHAAAQQVKHAAAVARPGWSLRSCSTAARRRVDAPGHGQGRPEIHPGGALLVAAQQWL